LTLLGVPFFTPGNPCKKGQDYDRKKIEPRLEIYVENIHFILIDIFYAYLSIIL
jgi:hypothetical protein